MSSVSSSTGAAASAANSQAYDELRVFYYLGSSITLVASLFVIFSYMKVRSRDDADRQMRESVRMSVRGSRTVPSIL